VLGGNGSEDILNGRRGTYLLTSGSGSESFVVTSGGTVDRFDCSVKALARDVITVFKKSTDLLRWLESNLANDTLNGEGAFPGTDQVRGVSSGSNTTIVINGDADMAADMALRVRSITGIHANDFQMD